MSVTNGEAPNQELLEIITFSQNGLVPAIAQQYDSGEVLMMAWMNEESLAQTLATREVHYWSRSRQKLWRKGETSGHIQTLHDLRIDCDGDTILLLVDQTGVACHTGNPNCFFRVFRDGMIEDISTLQEESADTFIK